MSNFFNAKLMSNQVGPIVFCFLNTGNYLNLAELTMLPNKFLEKLEKSEG